MWTKIINRLGKSVRKPQVGFFTHTVDYTETESNACMQLRVFAACCYNFLYVFIMSLPRYSEIKILIILRI